LTAVARRGALQVRRANEATKVLKPFIPPSFPFICLLMSAVIQYHH
jgi:hypothetical protein